GVVQLPRDLHAAGLEHALGRLGDLGTDAVAGNERDGVGRHGRPGYNELLMEARSHRWNGSGLELHVREWGAGDATALVVHGFQDSGATWDDVAVGRAASGLRVI